MNQLPHQREVAFADRTINRHFYSLAEVDDAVRQPVVQRLMALMKFRSSYPAFDGHFELNYSNDSSVAIAWRHGDHYCHLFADLRFNTATITCRDARDLSEKSWRC